jgi:hypothetical protein
MSHSPSLSSIVRSVTPASCPSGLDRVLMNEARGDQDEQEPILTLETEEGYSHNCMLGLTFGPDGWLYVSRGNVAGYPYSIRGSDGSSVSGYGDGGNIVRCRPDGSEVHEVATGFWNPFALTLDREAMHLKDSLMPRYAELVYYGFWFAPEREMIQALADRSQEHVEGTVRLKLYKGNVTVIGRSSPKSLYSDALVTFEDDRGAYDQKDAEGFIRLNALRLRTLAARKRG